VREVAVGGVDDGLDRLFQQVAADDLEDPARRYFFLEERFLRRGTFSRGYSIFALPEPPHSSSTLLALQLLLDARPDLGEGRNFTCRTSSSWMTWKP